MWFAVGLVSLCVVLAYLIRYRWHKPWEGMFPSTFRHIPYQYKYRSVKESTVSVEVGVAVPAFFRFELKRETWVDRFFKWVGLTVEKQFGHTGFDRLVYVASNDEHLFNRVADSRELRLNAQRIFVEATAGCRVQRVCCANGWLYADIYRGSMFSAKDDTRRLAQCMHAVLPFLDEVAEPLRRSTPPEDAASARDPYLFRAVLLSSISAALALNGLVFLVRPLLFDDAFILDKARLFELTLLSGTVILGTLLAAHLVLLARSARAHLFLLELLIVGSFGAYTTSATELRDANIEWDHSPPTVREAPVISKSISRSRKGGTRYYLHVTDWTTPFHTRAIKVSSAFYGEMEPGRVLLFEERPGYFGASWARRSGVKPK